MKWLSVKMVKPPCSRNPNVAGTPVLIWPRNPMGKTEHTVDGFCYYGRRVTGKPEFYIYGALVLGVKYWMPMPKGPIGRRGAK